MRIIKKKLSLNNLNTINFLVNKNYDIDCESNINLHSPLPMNFPEKIKMGNSHLEDVKYIMPSLDLTRTKKGNNNRNIISNNNNSQNTKANTEDIILNKKQNFDTDEWINVMKTVGLTDEEMDRFFKNKFIFKLIDAIDNLIGMILEKEKLILQIQYEKTILNNQIAIFKKDNITLSQNYLDLKKKIKVSEIKNYKSSQGEELNSSLVKT